MEHPCPKCGAAVEDGIPFCLACRAPQIRVVGLEPQLAATESSPSAGDYVGRRPTSASGTTGVHWRQALPVAALGGGLSLLLSTIPLAVFGPAFIAGGAFAVALYKTRTKDIPSAGTGAQIGAASGTLAFLFSAIRLLIVFSYHAEDLRKALSDGVSQLSSWGYDPDKIRQVLELLKTREGLSLFVSFGLFLMLVIFVGGGSLGGAWYGAWQRRRMHG